MMLNYKTGKLPLNFIVLGILLFAVSIWRVAVSDWAGILFLLISIIFLFLRSGIMIDADNRRVKKYIGFWGIKKGRWESIDTLINLRITKTKERQTMSVLSVSRTDCIDVYQLILILPDHNIELLSGKKEYVIATAKEIATQLQSTVIDTTM